MGDLYKSGIVALNEVFSEVFDNLMRRKGDEAQSPAQIAFEFPIEIIPYEDIYDVLQEAVQKKAYAHIGCFFKIEPSNMARDGRINRPKVLNDFRQIVCMRGEVYEYCTQKGNSSNTFTFPNGEWRERKIYQDIECKWHLWDGSYSIKVWLDVDRKVFTTNPPKPMKIYPADTSQRRG
jgi:hypothetical protein